MHIFLFPGLMQAKFPWYNSLNFHIYNFNSGNDRLARKKSEQRRAGSDLKRGTFQMRYFPDEAVDNTKVPLRANLSEAGDEPAARRP
jgi:hypothetical protein